MKSAWRVIITIVVVALLLGAICVAVGIFTGADMSRIYSVVNNRYHVEVYIQYIHELIEAFHEAGF